MWRTNCFKNTKMNFYTFPEDTDEEPEGRACTGQGVWGRAWSLHAATGSAVLRTLLVQLWKLHTQSLRVAVEASSTGIISHSTSRCVPAPELGSKAEHPNPLLLPWSFWWLPQPQVKYMYTQQYTCKIHVYTPAKNSWLTSFLSYLHFKMTCFGFPNRHSYFKILHF